MKEYEFDKVLADTNKKELIELFHSAFQVAFEQTINASSAYEIIKELLKKDSTKDDQTVNDLVIDMVDKKVNKVKDNPETLTGCHDFVFERINEWHKSLYVEEKGEDK